MNEPAGDHISFIGDRLLQPAVTLLDLLFSERYPGTTDVQTGAKENGYSASASLLLVVLLESFVQYVGFVKQPQRSSGTPSALKILRDLYPACPLLPRVEEVYVLRDVIAHNHIWQAKFSTKPGRWMTLLNRKLVAGGNTRYKDVVDCERGVTKMLGLKVVPTLIDRCDAALVFKTVLATLSFIDDCEKGCLGTSCLRADFQGQQDLDVQEVTRRIEASLPPLVAPGR
jgi:hypothetical protein